MLICVTNRLACREDFLVRIERVAAAKPDMIILREKDLSVEEYEALLVSGIKLCARHGVTLAVNFHTMLARRYGLPVHLPFALFERQLGDLSGLPRVGVSVHSAREAAFAQENGADYVTAGHIYTTACKPGLAPRGAAFLRGVCAAVSIPVFAIGGICPERIGEVMEAGASGVCLMSQWMTCEDPVWLAEGCRQAMKSPVKRF